MQSYLNTIEKIIKKEVAVVCSEFSRSSKEKSEFPLSFKEIKGYEGKNYKGYNVFEIPGLSNEYFLCVKEQEYAKNYDIELILASLNVMLKKTDTRTTAIINMLCAEDNKYLPLHEELSKALPVYLVLVSNVKGNEDSVRSICKETMDSEFLVEYNNEILIGVQVHEKEIKESCVTLEKNILSDLLVQCSIFMGGRVENLMELKPVYERCKSYISLKKKYNVPENIVSFEVIEPYVMVESMDKKEKEQIVERIFNKEFQSVLNEEMKITIDEFFKNNLNITDTALKLYVHRNTLIYRLDKIHKVTGFDLRQFNQSWIFRLGWIIKSRQGR